jgi:UDP-N-acetylmuramyl pentapeptide phosphotransferase/UDP-N-acetylglucosamine-1-phosphate transferase
VWVALLLGGDPARVVAAAILIALSTNLVNALDLRPGRALKWSLPILAISWVLLVGEPLSLLMATALAAGIGVLPFDLAEAGMLGDAGSNPLGFLAGVGLAATLPTWGLLVAAGVAVALQVVAETVTISRLIEAVPPLRWFDRLGRRS